MASIQEYLDLIKNAIYGKDVRQAIHDAIQQCYLDASGDHYEKLDREVGALKSNKVNQPLDGNNQPTNGTNGQSLRTKGDGTTEWASVGLPTDAQTAQAVSDWLDDHPEATTTVQDHSLTYEKLVNGTLGFVTPEMYGAKGDGTTDDSVAIQQAINSGLPCILSRKTYLCSETINLATASVIKGQVDAWDGDSSIIKSSASPIISVNGDFCEIADLTLVGTSENVNALYINSGRNHIHDISIKTFNYGIEFGNASTNLTWLDHVVLVGGNIAVYIPNNNNLDSQGMSFSDIDIRECLYGIDSAQPSNYFCNLAIQSGRTGGTSIRLRSGADKNIFVATYLENLDATAEVDLNGAHINQMSFSFIASAEMIINNDGSNIITSKSTQLGDVLTTKGKNAMQYLGVGTRASAGNTSSALFLTQGNIDNSITTEVEGTSAKIEVNLPDVILKSGNLQLYSQGNYLNDFGIVIVSNTPSNFPDGGDMGFSTSAVKGENMVAMCSCINVGEVFANCVPWGDWSTGITVYVKNHSGYNLSGRELIFMILYCKVKTSAFELE